MKRCSLILLVALGLTWVASVRTDGFSPALIRAPLIAEQAPSLSPEAREALAQPFHYFSKGRQCFVFASRDGRYVLKFFNHKYLQTPWYSFLSEEKERTKRLRRRRFYEQSYAIAWKEFGDEILYLHLGSSNLLPSLSLTDKAHRQLAVDLNELPFVLQKKGSPFYEGLEAVFEREGLPGLYREIDAFLQAVALRIDKHIADADSDVEHNWGYLDGRIFHLDPGRLFYDERLSEPTRRSEEWWTATRQFYKWLRKHYPEAAGYCRTQIGRFTK